MTGTKTETEKVTTLTDVNDQLVEGLVAATEVLSEDQMEQLGRQMCDKDGVLVIGKRKIEFFPAFNVFDAHRTPEELLKELKRKPGQKFVIKNGTRRDIKEREKYLARVAKDGEWDSGNLSGWQNEILTKLVADRVLTSRPGNDDEMTANGRPTIYEPVARTD
jgi:hypothetical protein